MDDRTCQECSEIFNEPEQVRRHLRKHGMTFQEYSLRWRYNNIEPTCKCGCGEKTAWNIASKGYAEFILGHHAWGRKKSDDEKRRIGEKNSENMKRYMQNHPDVAKQRGLILSLGLTLEARERGIAGMKRFWSSDSPLTHQRRREASDRAIALLEENKIGPRAPYRQMWIDNPFTGKAEYMHSSWETTFLMRCVRENYPVTKQHGIVIDYQQVDGTWHRYLPDFKALEEAVLFEIKGNLTENDELKLRAAEAMGYEVVLVRNSYEDEDNNRATQATDQRSDLHLT